jgi:alkylation response protein AidB-like acyl-CoA dehydrogenase
MEAWIVETDREGVTIDSTREKMGLRTCPFADVVFDGVEVPEANRIGPPKSGASIFGSAMDAERGFLLACEVGNLERMIDDSVAYARERKQFGQPIGSFQGISHRITDMKIRHETSRLLLYRTAVLAAQGRGTTLDAAVAKVHIGDAVTESALDAIRVHGARGYTTESLIERELRDSIGGLFSGGTPEIQRNIIARLLGLG